METCEFCYSAKILDSPKLKTIYRWRKLRKASHEGLNVRASEAYQPLQEKEAAVLVDNMLKDPNSWDDHLKRYLHMYSDASPSS
jgi:hypothetical protein